MNRRHAIPLGKILGIPIGLDWSWFLIFGLLTWSLALNYYPARFDLWPGWLYWVVSASTAIALFGSVLLHELGHAVAAMGFKVPVRRITLMIFGGVAELGDEPPTAIGEFVIALAGPIVSVLTALVAGGIWLMTNALMTSLPALQPVMALFGYLALINVMLAVFNMIPGFPLDGGRVLRAFLWGVLDSLSRATRIAASVGRFIAFGFIALGLFQIFVGGFFNGLWTILIGFFLQGAANSELRAQTIRDTLSHYRVEQVMTRNYAVVPMHLPLQTVVNQYMILGGSRIFVVEEQGQIKGLVTPEDLKRINSNEWLFVTVGQAMSPVSEFRSIEPDAELWSALRQMESNSVSRLLVMVGDQLHGILRREDVLGTLSMAQAGAFGTAHGR
ncbi:MAG: site-2 protease family protein [Chloroflexi bacterium]|nr:site-2 protease family protein [Chloroflexota bacterium]